jgi:multidrug resistance efflux pump
VSANPRVYSAPFAGKVNKVHYRNGDQVMAGAVLFEMDTEELHSQRAKLVAELNARTQAMLRFLEADETAKAGEEKANLEAIRNELSLVETKLSQAVVRADENGTVFDSDLFKREGETVALGEQLLNFAPTSSQQVELQIPDYLAMEIKTGQQGHFVTAAEPDRWYSISLERIETASTSEAGENIVKAIGKGTDFGADSKLGMSGFAQVSVGKQPGWWILFQKPVRYIQRKVWQL